VNSANNTAHATTSITVKPLRLTVSPHNATARHVVCFALKATSNGHAVRGVTVRFARHTAHTSRGTATICVSLRAGRYPRHRHQGRLPERSRDREGQGRREAYARVDGLMNGPLAG
jgi:hypothetical protein